MLSDLRARIDAVDDELIRLLNKRASIALEIARVKAELGMELFDGNRFEAVKQRWRARNSGPLFEFDIVLLAETVMDSTYEPMLKHYNDHLRDKELAENT